MGPETQQPSPLGDKFFADGRVRPFAGNTIICQLPQQGPDAACFHAVLDLYRAAPSWSFASDIAMLPPSSYHVTVFGGANNAPRKAATWPADLPLDLPISDCNRILADRLRKFRSGMTLPIRMKADAEGFSHDANTFALRILPVDDAEAARLTELRHRLADLLQIAPPNLDSYEFHITVAYLIRPLTSAKGEELIAVKKVAQRAVAQKSPIIALGAPEFCVFADMFAYDRAFYLTER